jgi:outer membrane protein OmpA-like peptidoglycan-associated protein
MAQLDVQPKKSNPWWLWLLFALIAIAILLFLVRGCNDHTGEVVTTDSTATKQVIAVTQPAWDSVDFNSPALTDPDPDITDADIAISGNDRYTIYSLGENILFTTDQNALQGSAGAKLKQIAASINRRYKGASIGVYGSADSTGTAGHNKQLGADRAGAVKNWLVSDGGIDAANISIHSLGESQPVATNSTATGRQQNRNVKIVAFTNSTVTK